MLTTRQQTCLNVMSKLNQAVTANELAMYFYTQGYTKFFNRNYVHPRLNELVKAGFVTEVGKKVDTITGKQCTLYSLVG